MQSQHISRAARRRERLIRRAVFASLAFSLVFAILAALWEQRLETLDGAFQTYAAVSEFAHGHALGVDFQSYLGALLPVSLVPFYWLSGGKFVGTAVGARIATLLALLLWAVVLGRLAKVARRNIWLLPVPVLTLTVLYATYLWSPGNSLRPLRWAIVPLVASAAFPLFRMMFRKEGSGQTILPAALLGALAASAVLWSNDTGIPTAGATFLSLAVVLMVHATWRRCVAASGTFLLAFAATALGLVAILTHGNALVWARYTFGEIPAVQFWLFAPWNDYSRLFGIADVLWFFWPPRLESFGLAITLIAAASLGLQMLRRDAEPVRTSVAFLAYTVIAGGAVLPQIGGHIDPSYAGATVLTALFAPFVVAPERSRRRLAVFAVRFGSSARRTVLAATVPCILVLLAAQLYTLVSVSPARTGRSFDPVMGLWVPNSEREAISVFTQLGRAWDKSGVPADERIMATYYSPHTIAAGAHPTTRYPSIIHALGTAAREEYARAIAERKAPIFTTIAPGYSDWETWNIRANWPLYRVLLTSYRPVARTGQHVFWRPGSSTASPPVELSCAALVRQDGSIAVEVRQPGERPSGHLLANIDLTVDLGGDLPRRWFWRAHAPVESEWNGRPLRKHGYDDASMYGLPPTGTLQMVAAPLPEKPYLVTLRPRPSLPRSAVSGARCRATPVAIIPELADLPLLISPDQLTGPED